METTYVYPGSFSPPTYGHLDIVVRAASQLEHLTILCSENPNKENPWFRPEEAAELWGGYPLPANVSVTTIEEFTWKHHDPTTITIVRGIRDSRDLAYEQTVMELNATKFGITRYLYLLASPECAHISSSAAREATVLLDLSTLSELVAPRVITHLIERYWKLASLRLVVGKPGSGKSTFLRELSYLRDDVVHINTDAFSKVLSPLVADTFPGEDIVQVAIHKPEELSKVIGPAWIHLLSREIAHAPQGAHVFVEAAYGLQENKRLYRFLGERVLHIGCAEETCRSRNHSRGTPQYAPFFDVIPGLNESRSIARRNLLDLEEISTGGSPTKLKTTAATYAATLEKE